MRETVRFCAKIAGGGSYTRGGAYLWNTTVLAGVTHASWVVGHK